MSTGHQHHPELDSAATDSVASSPRSTAGDHEPIIRFMCSFGGQILPRPHDNQLRYVGGDTRIVAVPRRATTFSALRHKLTKIAGKTVADNISIKYQLPNEDLDALITVAADEDVENMMDEYDRAVAATGYNSKSRLRLFLFSNDGVSRTSSISSLLDGSTKREHWFLDALNGGSGPGSVLERGRSEVSSIVSEVPDYLFGLDNSDEPTREPRFKARLNLVDNISNSDPGSPAPVVSSPFCSTSSSVVPPGVPPIPELPPVKTKPDNLGPNQDNHHVENFMKTTEPPVEQQTSYGGNPVWHYAPDARYQSPGLPHIPIYYVPSSAQPGNVPVHAIPVGAPPYGQPFPAPPSQVPIGYNNQPVPSMGQVYSGGPRPMAVVDPYNVPTRLVSDGVNQPVYYRNAYTGLVISGGEDLPVNGPEVKLDRVMQS